jgi:hypothetical protein
MRGIYDGEIRDRTHIFSVLVYLLLIAPFSLPAAVAFKMFNDGNVTQGFIILLLAIMVYWFLLIAIAREFIFLTINKEQITVKRPLLRISPFPKDKHHVVMLVEDIGEINITRRRKSSSTWRFISHTGKELLKINFEPEFISSTVDLDDYFLQNGIDIKLT